ncbi:hypothetical protein C1645_838241 [Glomus cerebriforme]|uniref:Uncharacterized protein n=1 Tax=Glomus cerebriforme TaxID=658196 RepID=A0A397S3X7_9GLOM|nr:hypothetical protein C1645_838241 [Glomus cerebriforme]
MTGFHSPFSFSFSILLRVTMSKSDSVITRSSISNLSTFNECKKYKSNLGNTIASDYDKPVDRTNRNHTSYFFHKDYDNTETAYYKHGISKHNYSDYLDANNESKEEQVQIINY